LRQSEDIVEFAKGQQPGVRRDPRPIELQFQPPVETEPQNTAICFSREWTMIRASIFNNPLIKLLNRTKRATKFIFIREMRPKVTAALCLA
jgi:hypothetical protein